DPGKRFARNFVLGWGQAQQNNLDRHRIPLPFDDPARGTQFVAGLLLFLAAGWVAWRWVRGRRAPGQATASEPGLAALLALHLLLPVALYVGAAAAVAGLGAVEQVADSPVLLVAAAALVGSSLFAAYGLVVGRLLRGRPPEAVE